jgi:hypothetical protein
MVVSFQWCCAQTKPRPQSNQPLARGLDVAVATAGGIERVDRREQLRAFRSPWLGPTEPHGRARPIPTLLQAAEVSQYLKTLFATDNRVYPIANRPNGRRCQVGVGGGRPVRAAPADADG